MRKNFGAKPWTYPQPVFILAAYDENGTPNAMNAAWGGISEDKELSMCISEGHKTTANILARKAFTVSMATAEQLVACDCDAVISIDHGFKPMEGFGGMPGSFCYPTGFMKGLMWAAEKELGRR